MPAASPLIPGYSLDGGPFYGAAAELPKGKTTSHTRRRWDGPPANSAVLDSPGRSPGPFRLHVPRSDVRQACHTVARATILTPGAQRAAVRRPRQRLRRKSGSYRPLFPAVRLRVFRKHRGEPGAVGIGEVPQRRGNRWQRVRVGVSPVTGATSGATGIVPSRNRFAGLTCVLLPAEWHSRG